jgi:IS30 family transposase
MATFLLIEQVHSILLITTPAKGACPMSQSCTKQPKLATIERTKIEVLYNLGWSISKIATELSRNKSTISRELSRGTYKGKYQAAIAQKRADRNKSIPRKPSKADRPELLHQIERLIRRKHSPEIIAHELGGIVSHTTIYTLTKTIRREWRKYLIWHGKTKYHKGTAGKSLIKDRVDISLRPAEVRFGDFEADTVISSKSGRSCLGVFVERTTRLYKVVKMANRTADEMVRAATVALSGTYVRSITYDNGSENAKHVVINSMLGCVSWFCRAYRSGDKGQIENRNKILRQYLPKKTNFDLITEERLSMIEREINERPMKCLNWQSPIQAFQIANPLRSEL